MYVGAIKLAATITTTVPKMEPMKGMIFNTPIISAKIKANGRFIQKYTTHKIAVNIAVTYNCPFTY